MLHMRLRHAIALSLLSAAVTVGAEVRAADLEEGYELAPPLPPRARIEERVDVVDVVPARPIRPPGLVYARGVEVETSREVCRVFLKPRVDPYGREVVHRVRVCDEGPAPQRAWGALPGPAHALPGRWPVPPRDIGPDFDGEPG